MRRRSLFETTKVLKGDLVTVVYNVTSTTYTTKLLDSKNDFSAMDIDGVVQPSVVTSYKFSTTGEHTVRYELTDSARIRNSAFYNCTRIVSITIPKSITSFYVLGFATCSPYMSSIVVESGNLVYDSRNNCNAIIKTSTNELVVGCQTTVIPNTVTSIGSYAFYECANLSSITIPNGVTSIGLNTFSHTALSSVTIPDSLTHIGEGCFSYCNLLTSLTIPKNVTTIDGAFTISCDSLASITVDSKNSVYDSRNNCNAIIETATNKLIIGCKNTVIPNGIITIGESAFNGCIYMTSMTIPNTVTAIGLNAFKNCSNMTSVNIPNGVTAISNGTFDGCSKLTSITIPSNVTLIGSSALSSCSSMTTITCNATTAPTIQTITFHNIKRNGTLYVPIGSSGYDTWMGTGNYYLGYYGWTKVEQ